MALDDISKPESILAAIHEYRQLGRDAFLRKYGFGRAREYFLVFEQERFDSKAIVGAAHGFEFPKLGPLRFNDFSGGAATVAPKLQELGFQVVHGTGEDDARDYRPFSPSLEPGVVYTREQLKELLQSQDATINTGIFHPGDYSSVLIFVTKNKTRDRTQYENRLVGNKLYFQGQSQGRTDPLIAEHRMRGLELLVFYRDSKLEHPGAGFRYEGRFNYISNSGSNPTSFVLRREAAFLDAVADAAEQAGVFEPNNVEDARDKVFGAIVRRRGQPAFRRKLLDIYEGRCAITGCSIEEVLEAAHIIPYQGPKTNHVSNGLLLRADLHTLFDLGLVAIDEKKFVLIVAPALRDTEYGKLHGAGIRLPNSKSEQPSTDALRMHREGAGLW